jgi:hypothetical protein
MLYLTRTSMLIAALAATISMGQNPRLPYSASAQLIGQNPRLAKLLPTQSELPRGALITYRKLRDHFADMEAVRPSDGLLVMAWISEEKDLKSATQDAKWQIRGQRGPAPERSFSGRHIGDHQWTYDRPGEVSRGNVTFLALRDRYLVSVEFSEIGKNAKGYAVPHVFTPSDQRAVEDIALGVVHRIDRLTAKP